MRSILPKPSGKTLRPVVYLLTAGLAILTQVPDARGKDGCERDFGRMRSLATRRTWYSGEKTIPINIFEDVTVKVVSTSSEGGPFNRLAAQLEKNFDAKIGVVSRGKGSTLTSFKGFWSAKTKFLVIQERDAVPGVVAHELRHLYFTALRRKGKLTVFAGRAGQTLEELFTYPLTIRLSEGPELKSSLNNFDANILLNSRDAGGNLTKSDFPARASSSLLESLRDKEASFEIQKLEGVGSRSILLETGEKENRQSISIGVAEREGVKHLAVTLITNRQSKTIPPLTLEFPVTEPSKYFSALDDAVKPSTEATLEDPSWQNLLRRMTERADRLTRYHEEATALTEKIQRDLKDGKATEQPVSSLIGLARKYAALPIEPLDGPTPAK